jgi:hypothetical protein
MWDRLAHRWKIMWDRPMQRWKLYSMVLQENSGTIYVEVKFQIRWNMEEHEFSHFHLCRRIVLI